MENKSMLGIGIIGIGIVGERLLQAFKDHPRTEVVGIFDANEKRLVEVGENYGIEIFYDSIQLIESRKVDCIYLAVPPKFHYSLAKEIIKRGKHIICEKPLANSLLEAEEMLALAEQENIMHAMNFPTVYRPSFLTLQNHVKKGFLGELTRIEVQCYFPEWPRSWQNNNWIKSREQGGFIREVFPHYIEMIQRLFGDIENVCSYIEYPSNEDQCEKSTVAIATLIDGTPILFNAVSDIGMKENLKFTLRGTSGVLHHKNWTELWRETPDIKEQVILPSENHFTSFINDIIRNFNGEPTRLVTFREGVKIQMVLEKILEGCNCRKF
ncbi:predicted dehydrogenase [Ureibacillus xyleni]|uniref:Predicted dehydrogenase n=1 Tax=Ureibacillus xyleni TaxID=614648 RepID=A0A285RD12_9BACL|nr:Gfo/Idh/MocA family oxidoreductase [Ureibacillus xyleni]SOB91951.1 predicted dehydrogenase [Ureibacillus xyleni]